METGLDQDLYFFMPFFGLFLMVFIVWYILGSVGTYTLAKNNGFEDKAIWAWIPFGNVYLVALMSGDTRILNSFDVSAESMGLLLIFLPMVSLIPIIGFFTGIANIIVGIYVRYNLYSKINSENALFMTIISYFIILVDPIYLFIKRDALFENYDSYKSI